MSLFLSLDHVPSSFRHSALAIGNFDGVHVGHQALIECVCKIKGPGYRGALTFSPHPAVLIAPNKKHYILSSDTQKAKRLLALGLDFVIIHPLTKDFLSLSPQVFIEQILIEKLAVDDVVVGEDFSFGSKAEGKVSELANAADNGAFKLHVVKDILVRGKRASSSAIRALLLAGDVGKAQLMLARPYSLLGRVSRGQGLGAPLGFATANIVPLEGFALAHGIYATVTRVYFSDGVKDFVSATNVGTRPTVTDSIEVVVETHCLEQNFNLLGLEIEIFFIERLRDEQKFSSISLLKDQVAQDFANVSAMAQREPERFIIKMDPLN